MRSERRRRPPSERAVGRTVVDAQRLEIAERLPLQRQQAVLDIGTHVVHGYDHGYSRHGLSPFLDAYQTDASEDAGMIAVDSTSSSPGSSPASTAAMRVAQPSGFS